MSRAFEEWYKRKYLEEPLGLIADVTRDAWNACLEHARQEFLQREIDRLIGEMAQSETAMQAFATLKVKMDDRRRAVGHVLAALEYLKEKS